jgi:hypothetical protein
VELYLVSSLHRSIRNLRDNIALLRRAADDGIQVSDELALLRAELAYTQTILLDFIDDATFQERPVAERRVGQVNDITERGILRVINNNPQDQFTRTHQVADLPDGEENQPIRTNHGQRCCRV